jgi:DMSO/TMAO reductase YedYZ molybdopterin-dependent catalytic subunit
VKRIASRIIFTLVLGVLASVSLSPAQAQNANVTGPSEIKIDGAVTTPLVLSLADAKTMPRKTLHVTDTHNNQTQVYEGVPLDALLNKAGAPMGDKIRGPFLEAYVMVEAADGYRVLFSLAELDSTFTDSDILVADTLDGAPLGPSQGPFKLVVPHEKKPTRWVRMLKSMTLVQVGSK